MMIVLVKFFSNSFQKISSFEFKLKLKDITSKKIAAIESKMVEKILFISRMKDLSVFNYYISDETVGQIDRIFLFL
jgi:hypothetical protein